MVAAKADDVRVPPRLTRTLIGCASVLLLFYSVKECRSRPRRHVHEAAREMSSYIRSLDRSEARFDCPLLPPLPLAVRGIWPGVAVAMPFLRPRLGRTRRRGRIHARRPHEPRCSALPSVGRRWWWCGWEGRLAYQLLRGLRPRRLAVSRLGREGRLEPRDGRRAALALERVREAPRLRGLLRLGRGLLRVPSEVW